MQRIAGAARAYRRIIEFDMPEIAQTMWAGSIMLLIKKMGRSKANAQNDANNILNSKASCFKAVVIFWSVVSHDLGICKNFIFN